MSDTNEVANIMEYKTPVNALHAVIKLLEPFSEDEQRRILRAVIALLSINVED